MKTATTFIFLILILSCSGSRNKVQAQNGEFQKLIIDYWTGDETYVNKRMEFTKIEDELIGKIIRPEYKIGERTAISEEVELSSDKIELLNGFWQKALNFKDACEQKNMSSSINVYTIISNSDTIKIDRYCDWQEYSYENLEEVIFSNFFQKLTDERNNLKNELSQRLNGIWYPITIKKEFKRGDILKLSKNKSEALDENCYWEFSNKDKFKSNCVNLLDLKLSESYEWDVDEGKTYFEINGGFITWEENGQKYTSVANFGATFIVKSITATDIELEYLWD